MQSEKNVDLELMFTEETKKDWCLCTDQQYISWLEKKLIEKLTVKPSSLHVKDKSTLTFEDWIKENKIETKNFGYIYKKKYYTVKNLYHKYEKEMAEL